jgi:hypothetical protein
MDDHAALVRPAMAVAAAGWVPLEYRTEKYLHIFPERD